MSTDSVSGTLHLRFWTQFREHLDENYGHIKQKLLRPSRTWTTRWARVDSQFPFIALQAINKFGLASESQADHIAYFDLLRRMRDAIEREIGYRLDWQGEIQIASRVIRPPLTADPSDESDWPNQVEWAAKTLTDFDRVFRPRGEGT